MTETKPRKRILQISTAHNFVAVYKTDEGELSYSPLACLALVQTDDEDPEIRGVIPGSSFRYADEFPGFSEIVHVEMVENAGYHEMVERMEAVKNDPEWECTDLPRFIIQAPNAVAPTGGAS